MTSNRVALLATALAAAACLAGCGKQADLARPKPLFGAAPPSAAPLARDEAARRALADAAVRGDPRAPQSYEELRANETLRRGRAGAALIDPSAPRPPGSPTEAAVPESSAPQ